MCDCSCKCNEFIDVVEAGYGDVIIIKLNTHVPSSVIQDFMGVVKKNFPNNKVMVIPMEVEISIIKKI